ncbi:MAG: hypothetical protein IIB95_12900 [Candidatus Marinimicrobia bacterium]|nr:hypothetical protein [Candidatus Neomarinimicrobiota bacterium]
MKFIYSILSLLNLLIFASCGIPFTGISDLPVIHPKNPIIIIPGIMGSQLVDSKTGDMVWGKIIDLKAAKPHEALIHPEIDGLELPTDKRPISENRDGLVPTNILTNYEMINRVAEVEAYQGLIQRFSQCGLREGNIHQCTARDNLYLFGYDWRRDLVETARLLGERIEEIQRVSDNPDQKVSFIAHSMGGIVATYYLMYGKKDVISGLSDPGEIPEPNYVGAKNVEKVFFLGVPFGGTPYAFKTLHEGEYLGPFVHVSQWITFTMPSLYEMLPLDTSGVFANEQGQSISIDHFDVENWIQYGMGIFSDVEWNQFKRECALVFPEMGDELSHRRWVEFKDFVRETLLRGKLFQTALAKMDWEKVSTKQILFGGNCHETLNRIEWIEKDRDKPIIRAVKSKRFSEKYYQTAKGDNTVLLASQLKAGVQADIVNIGCYKHRLMPSNPEIQQMIIEQL